MSLEVLHLQSRCGGESGDLCHEKRGERDTHVGEVMREHAWTEECCEDLFARSVLFVVPAPVVLETVHGKAFVVFAEPFGTRGIVWKTEDDGYRTDDCDDALDNEQPPEAFQASCAINVADAVGDCAAESTG